MSMLAIRKIIKIITTKISESIDSDVILSTPVLRADGGTLYLACFATILKPKDTENNLADRPSMYYVADVTDGSIKNIFLCRQKEFSDVPYNKPLSTVPPEGADLSDNAYDAAYRLLDNARQVYLENGITGQFRRLYAKYLDKITAMVPKDFVKLYLDLSLIPDEMEPEAEQAEEQPVPNQESVQEDDDEMPFADIPVRDMEKEPEADQKQVIEQQPAPGPDPVPEPEAIPPQEQAEPEARLYQISEIKWEPAINLTTLPEKNFRIMEQIADSITFLECDKPDQIRYEYPLFCFQNDRNTQADKWIELLQRIHDGSLHRGHYRTAPRKSIYTTCQPGKERGCIFGRCPYIVAAYIKYLKRFNPDELKSQRGAYNKLRFECDRKYAEAPQYTMGLPAEIDQAKLAQGLRLSDTGLIAAGPFGAEGDAKTILVTWLEKDNADKFKAQQRLVLAEEFERQRKDAGHITDIEGNSLPEEISYALLADYLVRTGGYQELFRKNKPQQSVKAPENMPKTSAPAPSSGNSQTNKPASASQAKPAEKTQPASAKPAPAQGSLDEYTEKDSYAYRSLTSENPGFYGTLYTDKAIRESRAIRQIARVSKSKGIAGVKMVPLMKAAAEDLSEKKNIYTVVGVREYLAALAKANAEKDQDMIGTLKKALSALKKLIPGTFILLTGTRDDIKALYEQDPGLREIYSICVLDEEEDKIRVDGLYNKFLQALPPDLKAKAGDETRNKFSLWYKKNLSEYGIPDESIPDYLAWVCRTKNSLAFVN